MLILGIETSCDETSAAVVEDGVRVRANIVASSKEVFAEKAGVIPEEAARAQIECMLPVIETCMEKADAKASDLSALAVTNGPGLLGSLLVGSVTARVLAMLWKKPLIPVHHTFGHLSSTWLEAPIGPRFPVLTLTVSGGHSDLWYRESHTQGKLLGSTRDDAAGEAFDKGASILGLPYPGGPAIGKLAESGDPKAFAFPLPLANEESFDMSFSGLKTALKYLVRDLGMEEAQQRKADIAASYEHAICAHLLDRASRAISRHPSTRALHIVGGVSANRRLREMAASLPIPYVAPPFSFCTDNAAMIAGGAYFLQMELGTNAMQSFTTESSLPLDAVISGNIHRSS